MGSSPELTVYVDLMSQPCRALLQLIRYSKLPVTEKLVQIGKGQHLAPEYRAVNPFGKVPVLQEGDWTLPDSAEDLRERATVDAVLHWHHLNTRRSTMILVFNRVLAARMKKPASEEAAEQGERGLKASLQMLEGAWLAKTKFLGAGSISIGDLQVCAELEMLKLLAGAQKGPGMAELLQPFPKVRGWMQRVAQHLGPVHAEINAVLDKVVAASRSTPSKL